MLLRRTGSDLPACRRRRVRPGRAIRRPDDPANTEVTRGGGGPNGTPSPYARRTVTVTVPYCRPGVPGP
eukprot:762062-Hanusia_phi.AAC.5